MTRYEHIELDISTAACHNLMLRLQTDAQYGFQTLPSPPREELMNLYNELVRPAAAPGRGSALPEEL
jgi:hypothetical protein